MKLNRSLRAVEQMEAALTEAIRGAVEAYVHVWQKIPALAWEAAQRDELRTSTYHAACAYGLWAISLNDNGFYSDIWVDCTTGKLLDPDNLNKEVSNEKVLQLCRMLERADPFAVIEKLESTVEHSLGDVKDFLWMQPFLRRGIPSPYIRERLLPDKIDRQLVEST